ncbi:MAG TPA: PilZ domain-containing protein [Blastocatellia bacterium]|nr:PilZ domain-containing protein [Blastocatellia bacterium]
MLEKRSEQRVQLDIPAKIRWKDSVGGINERDARLWNLSKSGAYVLTDDVLALNLPVELIVILESNDPYKGVATYFRGRIVRTETVHHSEGNTGAAISFEKNASATDSDEVGCISVA